MFRAAADTGGKIKEAYLYGTGATNAHACKDGWNPNCTGIYRNHLIERWDKLNVANVCLSLLFWIISSG